MKTHKSESPSSQLESQPKSKAEVKPSSSASEFAKGVDAARERMRATKLTESSRQIYDCLTDWQQQNPSLKMNEFYAQIASLATTNPDLFQNLADNIWDQENFSPEGTKKFNSMVDSFKSNELAQLLLNNVLVINKVTNENPPQEFIDTLYSHAANLTRLDIYSVQHLESFSSIKVNLDNKKAVNYRWNHQKTEKKSGDSSTSDGNPHVEAGKDNTDSDQHAIGERNIIGVSEPDENEGEVDMSDEEIEEMEKNNSLTFEDMDEIIAQFKVDKDANGEEG